MLFNLLNSSREKNNLLNSSREKNDLLNSSTNKNKLLLTRNSLTPSCIKLCFSDIIYFCVYLFILLANNGYSASIKSLYTKRNFFCDYANIGYIKTTQLQLLDSINFTCSISKKWMHIYRITCMMMLFII